MAFNWLDQWKDVGRKVNHSSFDLSKRQALTMPCGALIPHFCIETVPNEHHKINLSGILRTDTLNTAAFVDGTIHTNVFFVPYKQLWHPFNDFISQKHDPHSSAQLLSNFAPNILLTTLLEEIYDSLHDDGTAPVTTMFGKKWGLNALRLLQYLGYGNFYAIVDMSSTAFLNYCQELDGYDGVENKTPRYVNLWRILAYQHIFYDWFRNKYYDQIPFMCAYGTTAHDSTGSFDYVGTFNVDDITCGTIANSHFVVANTSSRQRLHAIFDLHYSQYKKDIYTSALPSTQFGAVSSISLKDINIRASDTLDSSMDFDDAEANYNPYFENGLSARNGKLRYSVTDGSDTYVEEEFNILNAFDVLQFRKAELMQQWKQNALRAGNQVDDNFESHYGVKPYYEEDNVVKFLGSFSTHLDVNPITATATTGASVNGNVGDLAAIGVGSTKGQEINFEAKDFGVIMAVSCFVPEVYYDGNGLNEANTLIEPFDYFYPEFQNVGFEALPLARQDVDTALNGTFDFNLGFVPPYSWKKTNVDEVLGDFSMVGNNFLQATPNITSIGGMRDWVLRRSDNNPIRSTAGGASKPIKAYYVSPDTTDPIFGVNYDGTPMTDPFALALNWQVRSIRPMSVLGLPIFG